MPYICAVTRREFTEHWIRSLSPHYDERESREILRAWLEDRHGITRLEWMSSERNIPEYEEDLRRLSDGEPVQYIIGKAHFDGLIFEVGPSVLIPRPETEDLVRHIAGEAPLDSTVLDIGTGSGCIAVALAVRRPDLKITAIDISQDALKLARSNASRNKVEIDFLQRDILRGGLPEGPGFDVVVSNPPYIEEKEHSSMETRVTGHEPSLALFVPDGQPMLFYDAITRLTAGQRRAVQLWFECHTDHTEETANILISEGFEEVRVLKDITGRNRIVTGRL